MPRDYDEARNKKDLTFKIRGETFKIRPAHYAALDQLDELQKAFAAKTDVTWTESFEYSNARFVLFLDSSNGQADKWSELVHRETDPVTFGELQDLAQWALEATTGVPTMPPSPSAPSPGSTKATSKAG